jgi:16S rRNA (cytidine1402-2'-O)-methyltransferase
MNGKLYIVATPIGNLEDITFRALKTLQEVDFIACEDTRITSILLKRYFPDSFVIMHQKLFPFYEKNEMSKMPQILNLLKNGKNVALVSDAGTPTISDPGFKLVRECREQEIEIVSIPGPAAFTSALVSSGLPTDKLIFLGFPPLKQGNRITLFRNLKEANNYLETTIIFYESPYKILKTLEDLKSIFGNIQIVVARELTKIYEKVEKRSIEEFLSQFSKGVKGELTVLFSLK